MSIHRKRSRAAGFTLAETLVVGACLAMGAATAVPQLNSRIEQGRIEQAVGDIVVIEAALERYRAVHHTLPGSLAQLPEAVLVDPWGHAYEYSPFTTQGSSERREFHNLPINSEYDLYSRGPDGLSDPSLNHGDGRDDIVRGRDGEFVGPARDF